MGVNDIAIDSGALEMPLFGKCAAFPHLLHELRMTKQHVFVGQ